ncbi:MAG TPA: transposase [Blastocatellia bacterium]|nr:transposase [Blastocatellia bacterium]
MVENEIVPGKTLEIDHPEGENEKKGVIVNTFGGTVRLEWEHDAPMTAMGLLPFFIEFLKEGKQFDSWVEQCPIRMTSPNAPLKAEILGTYLLGVLSGQNRYAHITALRNDGVTPRLLGMRKVLSEDAIRRSFIEAGEKEIQDWQLSHLAKTYEALLEEPYILDIDTTVKPLYGKQEGAVVGYNPHKPGRPSHAYHTYFIGTLRLAMDVEVEAGNMTAAAYTQPALWRLIDGQEPQRRPWLIRGDCGFGNESTISGCESRGIDYLFKLRFTANVKRLADMVSSSSEWREAGKGWEGVTSELRLSGWSRSRRVVVLRRRLKEKRKPKRGRKPVDSLLPFLEGFPEPEWYEYAVLVTSLKEDVLTIAQLYRDRADVENAFDELKNQWGWGGYTTHDMKRCQISARIVAQVYNWWSIFVRLAVPDQHIEGGTSRPLLMDAVGRQTKHSGQTTLKVTSSHAKRGAVEKALRSIATFIKKIPAIAEQLGLDNDPWRLILSAAFRSFLHGRVLGSARVAISTG